MIYQLMFAMITPALISGAYAERMKFSAMALFTTLWSLIVYFPMAHMVWGKGGLLNAYLGGSIPTFDFAGGTVVHITSGVSALVCALYLGKRQGYPSEPMKPHSMVLSVIGACLLWVGWFGFNAGSALAASGLATSAFVATHLAAACGGFGMDGGGMAAQRQAQHAGRYFGMRGRAGGHHAGVRFRDADARAADRAAGRDVLFLDGDDGEKHVQVRRHSRCVRRPRRGRNAGRAAHRRLRHQADQRRPINGKVMPLGLVDGHRGADLYQAVGCGNCDRACGGGNIHYPEGLRCADRCACRCEMTKSRDSISASTAKKDTFWKELE